MAEQKNYLDKKYILKPGKLLYYNHTHFNNDTLTDKIAENAIKKFPALIGAFLNERERAVLEAKAKAKHNISNAENEVHDEQFENEVISLIDAEKFDEAREVAVKILDKETRAASIVAINEGEENLKQAAEKAEKIKLAGEKAKKEAEEKEAKKLADDKAAAEKLEKEKEVKAKKAEAERKRRAAAKKEKEEKEAAEKAKEEKEELVSEPEKKHGLGKHS